MKPLILRKNNKEIREKLTHYGYKNMSPLITSADVKFNIYVFDKSFMEVRHCYNPEAEYIDCGDNEELFWSHIINVI